MAQQYIFIDKYFKQRLDDFQLESIPNLETKAKTISTYIKALESGRIEKTKEEAIQADFLNRFFGDILGYDYKDSQKWNLEKEYKSQTDTTKADGALGFFEMLNNEIKAEVIAVVELKDALTDLDKPQHRLNDKRTPVEQAFSYSSKAGGKCKWVIVSNFKEIRLYHSSDQGAYEKFIVSDLVQEDKLKRFFYILQKEHLISEFSESTIEKSYRERQEIEQTITKKFYNDYKTLRLGLFTHLKENNKGINELSLFTKTQKLLDRFIFVCFAEDKNLLPPYTLHKIKETNKIFFDFEPDKMWRQLNGLFQSIDKGNPPLEISKFNGGLFASDKDFDNLIVKDEMILKLLALSEYDFDSDINVNILGHIFEQSLSDIEEIKTQIGNGKALSHEEKAEVKKNGRRKKEGIFYTPEYITRYIVKEAVGGWLEDRKKELGFYDLPELTSEDFKSIKTEKKKDKSHKLTYNKNVEAHLTFWEAYKDKLRTIKVLDPACGSGAFLNQAFDFLYKEGQAVNEQLSALRLGQFEIFELDKHILTNNIFGVDLNAESVEITKLSLWLKTANKGKELTALDENIRCGNSLIDDIEIAGDKAFNWFAEFPQVFPFYRDKNKHANDATKKKIIQSGTLNYPDQGGNNYTDEISEPTYSYKLGSKGFEKYGFDIVIGNPPYGTTFNEKEKEYLTKFDSLVPDYEIYIYFISRGTQLLNTKGILSYIFPNTFLSILYGINYRKNILDKFQILSITDLSNDQTFEDASVRTCIFSVKNEKSDNVATDFNTIQPDAKNVIPVSQISYTQLYQNIDNWLKLFHYSAEEETIIDKLKKHPQLKEICEISQGLIPYDKYRGHDEETIKNRIWHADKQKDDTYRKELKGADVNRYRINWNGKLWISYGEWLAAPRNPKFFRQPRILIREIALKSLTCSYIEEEYYNNGSLINVILKNNDISLLYILSILNSKLIGWYHYNTSPKAKKGLFPKILVNDVRNIPIPLISIKAQQEFVSKADIMILKTKELEDLRIKYLHFITGKYKIESPSNKLQNWINLEYAAFVKELTKQKIKLTTSDEYELMQLFEKEVKKVNVLIETITNTDKEINKMVYNLYELTKEEISIVDK